MQLLFTVDKLGFSGILMIASVEQNLFYAIPERLRNVKLKPLQQSPF